MTGVDPDAGAPPPATATDHRVRRDTGSVPPGPPAFPEFRERFPWLGPDLQTLRNTLIDRVGLGHVDLSAFPDQSLTFPMPDGSGDRLLGRLNWPHTPRDRPLAILVHGLTGCEDSPYLRRVALTLLEAGFPTLRLNLRGAGPGRPLAKGQYHAGRSQDFRAVVDQLDPDLTANGVVAVGYSLGANMLLKCLGEDGRASRLTAAVAVSAPIDLKATQQRIMAPRNRVYHRFILKRMTREAAAPAADVTHQERERLSGLTTVYDFDNRFVAPRNGFGDADTYYARCSAEQFLPQIAVPTLVIHSLTDPWIPDAAYRRVDWAALPTVTALLPTGGGHLGFHGRGASRPWHERVTRQFLEWIVTGA